MLTSSYKTPTHVKMLIFQKLRTVCNKRSVTKLVNDRNEYKQKSVGIKTHLRSVKDCRFGSNLRK